MTLLHCNKIAYHTKYFSAMHKIFFFFICILGGKIIGKVFLDAGASLAAVLDSSIVRIYLCCMVSSENAY